MKNILKKYLVLCLITLILNSVFVSSICAQVHYRDEEIGTPEMIADAVIVRPLGNVAIVLGSLIFVFSLPFSLAGGNVSEACDTLIIEPVDFSWTRPLGDF